jgi:NAD(P)-dependent dehydrogenase (short-subunit alcohol dehydrogenase family)
LVEPFAPAGAVAVVTGGGSGIGQALCRALVAKGVAHVVVADLDRAAAVATAEALNAARPAVASAHQLDVAEGAEVAALAAHVEATCGPIALWCSNAGVHRGQGIGSNSDWQLSFGVNVLGHVHAAEAVMPLMVGRGAGHFVVTASAAGLLTDYRSATYSATKHAAVAFAEWLSINYGDRGVAVSCVCPEGVRTGMTRPDSVKAGAALSNFMEADEVAQVILEAIAVPKFLILPHPRVADFEKRRSDDRERWLGGMRKALARLEAEKLALQA